MIRIKVNKDKIFTYSEAKNKYFLNEKEEDVNFAQIGENAFNILINNQSINIELVERASPNNYLFKINNQHYEVNIQDETDLVLEKLGLNKTKASNLNEIKAPMPGLILEVLVKEGDQIQKGTSLIILEAMKMENVIKSTGEGTIKKILIEKGVVVVKNQLLIQL